MPKCKKISPALAQVFKGCKGNRPTELFVLPVSKEEPGLERSEVVARNLQQINELLAGRKGVKILRQDSGQTGVPPYVKISAPKDVLNTIGASPAIGMFTVTAVHCI